MPRGGARPPAGCHPDRPHRALGLCNGCYNARRLTPERIRAWNLKKNHGLTVAQYDALLEEQNGRCAICCAEPVGDRLHVDHDHRTGRIRGLLCHHCNTALGNFRDSITLLETAQLYLLAYRTEGA